MAKSKKMFVCNSCGEEAITWQGRCPVCGEWNTFQEIKIATSANRVSSKPIPTQVLTRLDIDATLQTTHRLISGIEEFDRVLGGGIVSGSVILLGGEPGVGKSTLLLQVAQSVGNQVVTAYFSGEESQIQVADRARRLNLNPTFLFANETRIDEIESHISESRAKLVIIDSIQTLYDERFPSTPGSLVQIRETALRLQTIAKQSDVTIILVGHITKEGTIGGPKTLEHMVDVVAYLEGDPRRDIRLLRCVKNRFGATHEVGLFTLCETGMVSVDNPALLFVESQTSNRAGSVITAVLEGVRPILVEVQSLVVPTPFGFPKRTALGIDSQRLSIILAILEARVGLSLGQHDVFVNVVGGYKLVDRAADLGICMSILSAASHTPLPPKQVLYGEVGLSGEIRFVAKNDRRRSEIIRLGFSPSPDKGTISDIANQFGINQKRNKSHA